MRHSGQYVCEGDRNIYSIRFAREKEVVTKTMKRVKSKDTSIELKLRKALWEKGYRYRKNYAALPGKPDIVLTKYKIAIFCDSEFFHGKDWEKLKLQLQRGNHAEYWIKKIERNRQRDREHEKKLLFLGFHVLRFWGKDILRDVDECVKVIEELIFDLNTNSVNIDYDGNACDIH